LEKLALETELIPGVRGVFEVSMDGEVLCQKTLDGFPSNEDIVRALQAYSG
jgi:predicted Rdx family selenoprotein